MNFTLKITVGRQGLYEITHKVAECVRRSGVNAGLVTLFIRHTSASLLIQENADPSVQHDLERWPACSLNVPLQDGAMWLGTWQGIYLWEHRHHRGDRELVVNVMGPGQ
jgi:thiamine phosphate synthase YjbQ (UPF0047 family)